MLGAVVGDIVGSRFEWNNIKSKEFDFFTSDCFFTDDSVMTLAVAKALLLSDGNIEALPGEAVKCMREVGQKYPSCGYGTGFMHWLLSDNPQPYNSLGNGSAMRVSACGMAAGSIAEAKAFSDAVTAVTHNHPEGISGAQATAVATFLAKSGERPLRIRSYIREHFYPMDYTLDEIRESYSFSEYCRDTVPVALQAFFESFDFADAISNAISVGGDSDTIAAITGAVAGAYYGVPSNFASMAETYLDARLLRILHDYEEKYPPSP